LRSRLQQWLTQVVFRRPSLELALQKLRSRPTPQETESQYLSWAVQELAAFVDTKRHQLVHDKELEGALGTADLLFPASAIGRGGFRGADEFGWAEAVVPLRFSQGDIQFALLGRRRGGSRYLSEDLSCLGRLATAITEQVERLRAMEMQRLVSQAELRALQAQINPHFLFNALNTLYGTIPREIAGARRTVLNLAEIFRYFLQPDKTYIPLEEELKIINAYLEIERLRLGARLQTCIDVDKTTLPILIPILSVQPLVENAIKHGVSAKMEPGMLTLRVRRTGAQMAVSVEDTGPGFREDSGGGSGARVGLANVSRRLELCYGPGTTLKISSSSSGTRVEFVVPFREVPF
jgi:LytS/YehU family sensor histidine kinase